MQTWTLVRFLHIVAIVFFVGGQLMLVAAVGPAIRKRGNEETLRLIARRFGIGSTAALALVVATGIAMASHFSLWHSDVLRAKLMVLVLVGVLLALHVLSPTSRAVPTQLPPRHWLSSGSASNSPTADASSAQAASSRLRARKAGLRCCLHRSPESSPR